MGPRQARHEPQQQAADDQEDRVRDPEAARDRGERGYRDEQRQNEFGASHATAPLFRIAWRRRSEPSGPRSEIANGRHDVPADPSEGLEHLDMIPGDVAHHHVLEAQIARYSLSSAPPSPAADEQRVPARPR